MPASRSARATIFTPRSWPSSPTLAMITRMVSVLVFTRCSKSVETNGASDDEHYAPNGSGAATGVRSRSLIMRAVRVSAQSAVRRAVPDVDITATGELCPLCRPDFAKWTRRPPGPDPTGLHDRSSFDPRARRNAAPGLHDHAIRDPRHDADEAIVAKRSRTHLHVVTDRHACTEDEIAARLAREQKGIVLHIAPLPDDDAA